MLERPSANLVSVHNWMQMWQCRLRCHTL